MFSGSALSGMFVAVKVLLQIQSSGTLLPHTQQVHRSQSLVTCEGRPPAQQPFSSTIVTAWLGCWRSLQTGSGCPEGPAALHNARDEG